ncbi:MAG: hypothetical protein ACSHYA_04100 [Opitutaceae bacterium]
MPLPLKFLTIAVFLLACVPRMNISVGPVPIYVIDVCLFGAIWYGGLQRSPHLGPIPHAGFCICILSFALLSELLSMLYLGTYVETVYMSARMCLAVAFFFIVNNLIKEGNDLVPLLKAAVCGMIITSFLMAMTSLPGTRELVAWVFKNNLLSPVGEDYLRSGSGPSTGTRGRSLIGYNIISAWFVALIWPLAIVLYRHVSAASPWKSVALAGCILGPFGVIFAYSRGALLGLLLILTVLLLFGEGKVKGQIALVIFVATSIIGFFGWDSDLFYFERIERRTLATFDAPFENEMESERFGSYIAPFQVVAKNPLVAFIGEGLTINRVRNRGYNVSGSLIDFGDENIPDHSVFSKATLKYGFLASLCYLGLWACSSLRAYSEARQGQSSEGLARSFPQLVFASVVGLSAWVAFDKGIIIQPRGAMMFFFITGLVGVCQNLRLAQTSKSGDLENAQEPKSIDPIADLYR